MATQWVHIKTTTAQRLVYHRFGPEPIWNYDGAADFPASYKDWVTDWYEQMACGVRMPITNAMMPRWRADLIARPCRRCFPADGEAA